MLASVNKGVSLVDEVLENYPNGVLLPYKSAEGHEESMFVTKQFAFGMHLVLRSIYRDLANTGEEQLAGDILRRFK